MKILWLAVVCAVLLSGCGAVTKRAPDYTVVAKTLYGGNGTGAKLGYYVTIVIGGVERETYMGASSQIPLCFIKATLGVVLPPDCR